MLRSPMLPLAHRHSPRSPAAGFGGLGLPMGRYCHGRAITRQAREQLTHRVALPFTATTRSRDAALIQCRGNAPERRYAGRP
jgi:hypothetical protein